MKKKFQLYKNLILVVASALTLIAVTFAWFSVSKTNVLNGFNNQVSGSLVTVNYYEKDNLGSYVPLNGDISLDGCVAGTYRNYRMIVKTATKKPLKLSLSIDDLPSDMPTELKDSVCIKYELKKVTKSGNEYIDGTTISYATQNVPLSTLTDDTIFSGISLKEYQTTNEDYFAIYYQIGLKEDSPTEIEGLSSELGSINISAQQIG